MCYFLLTVDWRSPLLLSSRQRPSALTSARETQRTSERTGERETEVSHVIVLSSQRADDEDERNEWMDMQPFFFSLLLFEGQFKHTAACCC